MRSWPESSWEAWRAVGTGQGLHPGAASYCPYSSALTAGLGLEAAPGRQEQAATVYPIVMKQCVTHL